MTTLFLEWNSDLVLQSRTSLQIAVNWDEVRQRIIRRIITNPAQQLPSGVFTEADYIFDQGYGIGLGRMVGELFDAQFLATVERRIRAGVLADAAVATTIPPSIQFLRGNNPQTLLVIVGVTLLSGESGQIQLAVTR